MRPFTLPESPTRADSSAYCVLCERPDIWNAWVEQASKNPAAPPSSLALLIRLSGIQIDLRYARAIGRIYAASMRRAA